jgi:RNA polymerase sigma-70 factor (ECF subfamily)
MSDTPALPSTASARTATTPAREEGLLLARRAAAGDAVATRALLESVAPRVVRTARTVLGAGHPEVEDAVQLALIGFIQSLPGFRGECAPSLFAARIAVRTASAVHRRSRARQRGRDDSVDIDALEGARRDPLAARRREVVRTLLDDLPEEQAEALALRFMLGWSLNEIADSSGAPLNTVRSRLRLAKQALRRRIEADPALASDFRLPEDEP